MKFIVNQDFIGISYAAIIFLLASCLLIIFGVF